MARTIDVESWGEFEAKISELRRKQETDENLLPYLLYRGHANSEWRLKTTLERNNKVGMQFGEYYRLISFLKPEIETFTRNAWSIPEYPNFMSEMRRYDFLHTSGDLNTSVYGYMSHLRHHGFPSPLLDWTHSLYVAAYFAFALASEENDVSIYALSEARMHSGSAGQPIIRTFGPHVKTHRRHFQQQCEYTMCVTYLDNAWIFSEHERAFEDRRPGEEYPVNSSIHKFNIPGSERKRVLKMLDEYNLNAFSLFASEESLMETLALRHLYFSDFQKENEY